MGTLWVHGLDSKPYKLRNHIDQHVRVKYIKKSFGCGLVVLQWTYQNLKWNQNGQNQWSMK